MKKIINSVILACSFIFGCFIFASCSKDVIAVSVSEQTSNITTSIESSESTLLEFQDIVFANKEITYDGEFHSLEVENLIDGAEVTYSGNNKKNPGTYTVKAFIIKDGYKDTTLSATLTINKAKFENVTLKDTTVYFDNDYHNIEALNVPSDAYVKYTNNHQKYIGEYSITAEVSLYGYETLLLSANLSIVPNPEYKNFTDVVFEDQQIEYTGSKIWLLAENVPSFAEALYSNNGKIEKGSYDVTCFVEAPNYNVLILHATLKITGKLIKGFTFEDITAIEGQEYTMEITTDRYFPKDGKVTYTTEGYRTKHSFSEPGVYKVTATMTATDYEKTIATATLTIISKDFFDVDESKTAYTIPSNVKYSELFEEIKKGNFSVEVSIDDEYFYQDGSTKYIVGDKKRTYVTNDSYVSYYESSNGTTDYKIASLGDNVFWYVELDDSILNQSSFTFAPKEAFYDTFAAREGGYIFGYLNKDENDNFVDGSVGGYVTTYSTFKVDSVNNAFIIESRCHYFHPEFNHDEVTIYSFYNIGNTAISIPEILIGNEDRLNEYNPGNFIINGIEYDCLTNFDDDSLCYRANVTLDAIDLVNVAPGTYYLLPKMYEIPVTTISYDYYQKYYYLDTTGYFLRVFYDSLGYYQGEYADCGKVKYYKDVYQFGEDYYYFDEWNQQ